MTIQEMEDKNQRDSFYFGMSVGFAIGVFLVALLAFAMIWHL